MICDQYWKPTIKYDGIIEDAHIEPGALVKDNWENIELMVQTVVRSEGISQANVKLLELIDPPPGGSYSHNVRLK